GVKVAAMFAILIVTRSFSLHGASITAAICSAVVLIADLGSSHAEARLTDSALLTAATASHELGAALWLGGLPSFRMALASADDVGIAVRIGRRYSAMAIAGVALIATGAVIFSFRYIGTASAVYGTAYGAMAAAKTVLFGALLALGLANFFALHVIASTRSVERVGRFVEVEMGVGFAVLMAAASITSMPPAVDLIGDRVTLADLAARMAPAMPRLESPGHATLAVPALQRKLDAER